MDREGYLVVPGVLDGSHVAACLAALTALATDPRLQPGQRDRSGAFIALEPAADPTAVTAANRADLIRKFGDFTDASPALLRAAMSARLHAVLDALMGQGRVLLQEMALVTPPKVSGEKPWHQDAAYFRGSDPNLMFGVWIALDRATRENGCMEVIPGSHLRGPAPHVPAKDINLSAIRPDLVRRSPRPPASCPASCGRSQRSPRSAAASRTPDATPCRFESGLAQARPAAAGRSRCTDAGQGTRAGAGSNRSTVGLRTAKHASRANRKPVAEPTEPTGHLVTVRGGARPTTTTSGWNVLPKTGIDGILGDRAVAHRAVGPGPVACVAALAVAARVHVHNRAKI